MSHPTTDIIIHPDDRTTDFLHVYGDQHCYNYVNNTVQEVDEAIAQGERIIMLGHGSPQGLFAINPTHTTGEQLTRGVNTGYIVGSRHVNSLLGKDNVYIRCNAKDFVCKYHLAGLTTGMFISEVEEAHLMGVHDANQALVDASNMLFIDILRATWGLPSIEIYKAIKARYTSPTNCVIRYNAPKICYVM